MIDGLKVEKTIEIQNLTKRYGEKKALAGITFSVNHGSCFGLLGPNGAGKSTTMKILTGIIDADSGIIRLLGHNCRAKRDNIKKQVGYVPQEITLYDKLTANDNLRFFGELYGITGIELKRRIQEVLEQVGLVEHSRRVINTFSGGMKRRINIAAALLHHPKILIMDEPTVGIDPQSRNYIFQLIRELKNTGVTIIYSTHYMEEAENLCDDLAIIDQGKVITQGTVGGILDKHASNTVHPNLENVFLTLTGTSLRD